MISLSVNCLKIVLCILLITAIYRCDSKNFNVSTSEDLKVALLDANPGDNISLSGNTTFHGTFVASKNGLRGLPISILTENFNNNNTLHAKIVGEESNYNTNTTESSSEEVLPAALTVNGDYYNLENIKIVGVNKSLGLFVGGTDVSLEGVLIQNANTGLKIKGVRSYLKDCSISQVKSGIQVEGDFSIIRDTFVTGDEIISLVAEKETCCGTLMGNIFDGKVIIKGTDYNLFDNLIEGKAQ